MNWVIGSVLYALTLAVFRHLHLVLHPVSGITVSLPVVPMLVAFQVLAVLGIAYLTACSVMNRPYLPAWAGAAR
jgi:hypothetical protein